MGSDIALLTVFESEDTKELENYYWYIKKIQEATQGYTKKYFEKESGKTAKVMIVTQAGNPAEGILEDALTSSFPLIIMASHGRSGMSRWAVGSVADKVVRSSSLQPVMLIRANDSYSDLRDKRLLRKALVPLDGSFESEAVIPYISNIAFKIHMELTLLQVVPKTNQVEIDAESYLASIRGKIQDIVDVDINYKVCVGPVAETIIDLADELTVDLVAMSTHGMNRNNPLSLGSVAQKVFLGGNTPLLLIKK